MSLMSFLCLWPEGPVETSIQASVPTAKIGGSGYVHYSS